MLQHVDTVLGFAVVILLLSLLVTTLVQMVITVFGVRALALKWGIERLLRQVVPELSKEDAQTLADAVSSHESIKHTVWGRATDIRKDELVQLLGELCKEAAGSLCRSKESEDKLRALVATATTPETTELARNVKAELERSFPNEADHVRAAVDRATAKTTQVASEVGAWFDTVMDRTTEVFMRHTRWITVVVAALLALVFQIDSLAIFRQLASDPELRAKMVATTESVLKESEKVFANTTTEKKLASMSIEAIWKSVQPRVEDPNARQSPPAGLVAREEGESWLVRHVTDSKARKAVLVLYGAEYDRRSAEFLNELHESARRIQDDLKTSELEVFHNPATAWGKTYWEDGMRFVGVLITALFLSLGAPFWYNTLRQLSTLRPIVAEKIEPKGRPKK